MSNGQHQLRVSPGSFHAINRIASGEHRASTNSKKAIDRVKTHGEHSFCFFRNSCAYVNHGNQRLSLLSISSTALRTVFCWHFNTVVRSNLLGGNLWIITTLVEDLKSLVYGGSPFQSTQFSVHCSELLHLMYRFKISNLLTINRSIDKSIHKYIQ